MATFAYTLAGVCEKIIRSAKDMAGQNYAMNLGAKTGAIDFITSSENGGIKASYVQEGPKLVRAKVLYKQRSLACEIQSGADGLDASVCDTATEPVEKSVNLTIGDRISSYPKKFTNSNLVQICQDTKSWVLEYLMSDLRAMREKLSQLIISKIAVNAGVNNRQDGNVTAANVYTSVDLLKTTTGVKVPLTANWNDVLMDYSNNKFNGAPAFISQGNLQTFMQLSKYACCNASTPYANAIAESGSAFFLDQTTNIALGVPSQAGYTRALMVAYGASHLLWFNENVNVMIDTEILKSITIQDPVYPQLRWDLDFRFDICTKTWTYMYSAYFDIFNVFQADSFKQNDPSPACDDELYGETGIWKYTFGSV